MAIFKCYGEYSDKSFVCAQCESVEGCELSTRKDRELKASKSLSKPSCFGTRESQNAMCSACYLRDSCREQTHSKVEVKVIEPLATPRRHNLSEVQLIFEVVDSNLGYTIQRAKVPGGWLVMASSEVTRTMPDGSFESGWEWRPSLTFVPDAAGDWMEEIE